MPSPEEHWNAAHDGGDASVSWTQKETPHSLGLIRSVSEPGDSVVDIGGGSSTLAGALLDNGYDDITVVDISDTGLAIAREPLGDRAGSIEWVVARRLG